MKRITRLPILVLILLACILSVNAFRPVDGRTEEDDLKKQVETLTKKVEDQKKQLDSLSSDYAKFRAQQVQWDNSANAAITQLKQQDTQQTQWVNGTNVAITQLNQRDAQQTQWNNGQTAILRQHDQRLSQIEAQLRRR